MSINITILGQAISFVIFVLFCMKYIWKPIISVIEKRQKLIADSFSDAEQSKKMSEMDRIEANNCLNQAKCEAELIVKKANQYGTELINQAKNEAEIEKNKILLQARHTISFERKCIAEELQKEISSMVILGIERILKCSVDKHVDSVIVNQVISELRNNK